MTDDAFDGLEDLDAGTTLTEETAPDPGAPSLYYGSVDEFVRKHLRFQYRRVVGRPGRGEYRWRAAWWQSEEAIGRLEAVWRTWEGARQEAPTAMSDWWLNHLDRHMQALLSVTGPFANSTDETRPGDPLPYESAPQGWFAPDRQP